jgi:hypothetical protein
MKILNHENVRVEIKSYLSEAGIKIYPPVARNMIKDPKKFFVVFDPQKMSEKLIVTRERLFPFSFINSCATQSEYKAIWHGN